MSIPTTYTEFVAALVALKPTGVKRRFGEPPASLGTTDLPALYPMLPRGTEPAMTFVGQGGWPAMVCDLVIAVEPVGQGTQPQNYKAMLMAMDNLSTALRSASIGRAKLTWTVTANAQVVVAGIPYWAVIATIEGR